MVLVCRTKRETPGGETAHLIAIAQADAVFVLFEEGIDASASRTLAEARARVHILCADVVHIFFHCFDFLSPIQ